MATLLKPREDGLFEMVVQRDAPGPPTGGSLYGGQGLFSPCAHDNLINATVSQPGIANWLDWVPSIERLHDHGIMTFAGLNPNTAYAPPDAVCDDCQTVGTVGFCEWSWAFGDYCTESNPVNLTEIGLRLCDRYPVFRMIGALTDAMGNAIPGTFGARIEDDWELQMVLRARAMATIIAREIWRGTGTGTSMQGLENINNTGWQDRTGIDCEGADPDVKVWGRSIADRYGGWGICDYVSYIVQNTIWRAQAAGLGMPGPDDMAIWSTPNIARDLIFQWDCCQAQRCAPSASSNTVFIDSAAINDARDARFLIDGVTLFGVIEVDGIRIPVYGDHSMTYTQVNGVETADIHLLVRRVGGTPTLWGEFQNFNETINPQVLGSYIDIVSDGGRWLFTQERRNRCINSNLYAKPRVIEHAPFLNGRITGVQSNSLQLVPYPEDTYGGRYLPQPAVPQGDHH